MRKTKSSTFVIDKHDEFRILLTELTPYETPIVFSNIGVYRYFKFLQNEKNTPSFIKEILQHKKGIRSYIPFDFLVKKTNHSHRKLSLIHPVAQSNFVSFYKQYDALITNLCSKSPFSIRYPHKVANRYYEKSLDTQMQNGYSNLEVLEENAAVEIETNLAEPKHSSSYFSYKKYNFLYKFHNSYEFHRLEKKFHKLIAIDISKCFYSIYTHSICWAVKSKDFSKANIGRKCFESDFDSYMQEANYGETNGIVVGPEISRIFAEIILQKIDLTVANILKKINLHFEIDYSIRRYIDDFFIFFNDDSTPTIILNTLQKELESYKLYLNESKTRRVSIPFITNISIAKMETKPLLDEFFSIFYKYASEAINATGISQTLPTPSSHSNKTILKLKALIKKSNTDYDSLSNYLLSIIKKKLSTILNNINTSYTTTNHREIDQISHFILLSTIDFLFFIYASCLPKPRATYLTSSIIVNILKFTSKRSNTLLESVEKKIFDEIQLAIKFRQNKEDQEDIGKLDLIIALKHLNLSQSISQKQLAFFFNLGPSEEGSYTFTHLNYFQLTTILYYIGNSNSFEDLKTQLVKETITRYSVTQPNPFISSELTHLFFDLLSCPYISKDDKQTLVKKAHFSSGIQTSFNPSEVNKIIKFVEKNAPWFTNWDPNIQLEALLHKKELKSPY